MTAVPWQRHHFPVHTPIAIRHNEPTNLSLSLFTVQSSLSLSLSRALVFSHYLCTQKIKSTNWVPSGPICL